MGEKINLFEQIFEATDDLSTLLKFRSCNRFFKSLVTKKYPALFTTLKLNRNSEHAKRQFERAVKLGLVGVINEIVFCSSCYYDVDNTLKTRGKKDEPLTTRDIELEDGMESIYIHLVHAIPYSQVQK